MRRRKNKWALNHGALLKLIILHTLLQNYVIYLCSFALFVDEKYRISVHSLDYLYCTVPENRECCAMKKQQQQQHQLQIDKLNWWMLLSGFVQKLIFSIDLYLIHITNDILYTHLLRKMNNHQLVVASWLADLQPKWKEK